MFDNRIITKNDLFKYVNSIDVFKNYCPGFEVGRDISSPFRKDSNPSFGIIKGSKGEFIFKDLATGESGDCIDFVQKLFMLSYFEALSKIATDFKVTKLESFFYKDMSHIKTTVKEMSDEERGRLEASQSKAELRIRRRDWNNDDANFWFSNGITYNILMFYEVVPISHFFVNNNPYVADKLAYAYIEHKDDVETYKIYQPYNTTGFKWLSSHDSSVWQGWTKLPEKGTDLIITKSLKDVMSIVSTLRIPAVALQSENTKPKPEVIEYLKSRFNDLYIFYDNDFDKEVNIGRLASSELSAAVGAYMMEVPDEYKSKDYTDTIQKHGVEAAKAMLQSQIIPF